MARSGDRARTMRLQMETDSFFYNLFNQLPQTLFELLDLPAARAKH